MASQSINDGIAESRVWGYLPVRDLGDGQVEPWEQTGGGTWPLWGTAEDCRAAIRDWHSDPDVWRVCALVEQDAPGGDR